MRKRTKIIYTALVFILVMGWIFSGWPQVWRNPSFPQKARPAHAATFQMQTGYYIGTGAANTISGLGFQPDLVIIKADTGLAPVFKTSAMPISTSAYFPATANDTAQNITLISDGFTVGTLGAVNTANIRYTWIAFGGSDCSSSGTFCVGSYAGTGATQSITTGFQPDLVWAKSSAAVSANWRSSSMPTNYGQYFINTTQNTTGALYTTFNATGFTVGATNSANGVVFNYVAFKQVSGAMKVGAYTGNATDNTNITGVGFVPNFVFVKNANASTAVAGVYSVSESYGDYSDLFTATANAVNHIQALQTDGFQIGNSSNVNGSGNALYYAAFAGDASPASSGTFVMATGSYTGTGAARSITGVGFSPDLVIVKSNTTAGSIIFKTRLMQSGQSAYLAVTTANLTTAVTSLDGDGFSLGTSAVVNGSGVTYYWTAYGNAWRSDTNTGASNFTVFAYYGNGIDNRNITRLPFQPDFVTAKSVTTAGTGAWKSSAQTGDLSGYFAGTPEAANLFQSFNADGFQVGTAANVNSVGILYFGFAFGGSNCSSSGTFCVGTYSGNGGVAQNITSVGFQPTNVWIKDISTGIGVSRNDKGATDSAIPFTALASVTGAVTGLLSNGFSVGTNTTYTNAAGTNNYRYIAWRAPTGTPKVGLLKNSDGWSGAIPFYIDPNGVSTSTYPYARAQILTPAGLVWYASASWNVVNNRFEGTVYPGSNYCAGCADPNVGEYVVMGQMSSASDFSTVNYNVRAGMPNTFITRRWNAINTSSMGNSTDYAATWSTDHWNVTVSDFSIYASTAAARTAVAIPFIPTSSAITITNVTIGGSSVSQGSAASTTNAWWWDSDQHALYVQPAAALGTSQTARTILTFSFTADTDLWATRVDDLATANIGERQFYNGIMVANQYVYTTIFGGDVVWSGTHVNAAGEQAELTGHKPGTGDVNLDCMERVAVHVDETVLPDSSNYYSANIKWAGEWQDWITEATNDHITMVFHNDTSPSTGWIQYLDNGISATRTQTYYAGKRYIKNDYQFTNNDTSAHSLPFIWMREQWLGTDQEVNDRGRFSRSIADETTETSTPITSLSSPWWMNYDIGSLGAQGIIAPEAQAASATAYLLEHPPITTNVSPWAEWPVVVTYPVGTSPQSSDIVFTKLLGTIASGSSTSLTFWQWGAADLTNITDITNAISADTSALNPPSTMAQAAYRLFNNANSTDVGTALAAQNTPVTLGSAGAVFRARVLANVSGADLALGKQFKLQYADKGAGTCATPTGTWADVSASTPIAFNNNTTPANGDALTANANDPTDGSNTIMNQTYVEANPVSNTQSVVLAGQDGKWDFSLKDNGAPGGTTYCLRMLWNSGTLFSLYSNYPQITIASSGTVSCSTSPSTTSFGTLNLSGVATALSNTTTTLSCTYGAGCTLYVNDAGNGSSAGLWAGAVSHLIASANSTLVAGTEGYGIQAATTAAGSGATLTLASAYNQTGNTVGGLLLTQELLAGSTASFSGREVVTMHKAAIAGVTPAGSYADTITYSCVGN